MHGNVVLPWRERGAIGRVECCDCRRRLTMWRHDPLPRGWVVVGVRRGLDGGLYRCGICGGLRK